MDEEPTEDSTAQIERLAALEQRITDGPDGSLKVTLLVPAKLRDGGQRAYLHVRPAVVSDLRAVKAAMRPTLVEVGGEKRTVAGEDEPDAWMDALVQPRGAHLQVELLEDLAALHKAVDQQVGKFLRTGPSS